MAKGQGDDSLPRPWSKHSMGSSAFDRRHPEGDKSDKDKKREVKAKKLEIEAKKSRFREFLKLSLKSE